jgi:hypothetical protein
VKFRLLLVDANIIIELFRLGIWDTFLAACEVHLSETVFDEAHFYEDDDGERHTIHLQPYRDKGQVTVHAVPSSQLATLRSTLGVTLLEKMDPGEAELLCVLDNALPGEDYLICSADAVIFRYLGATHRSGQGISLEEILPKIGITKPLESLYRKAFRERYSQLGFSQGITGLALR